MKIALTFVALLALAYSAPEPRKLFHENYEDFLNLIIDEVGAELNTLAEQYLEYDEFLTALDYLQTPRFRNIVYEMEDLPEFKAVVNFLEANKVDILYIINIINEAVDSIQRRSFRQQASGRDLVAYIQDSIELFPKEKLVALYEQKIAEDADFKQAMESFYTEEWDQLYSALWENETFLNEVQELKDSGIDLDIIIFELRAVLGLFK